MSVKNHWQKIHQKLQQRISKHYLNITSINSDVAKEPGLEPIITQLKSIKPALDQSALEVKIWGYVWTILQHICFLFDEFSNNIKKYKNILPVPLSLFWHLSKVVSISRDIKTHPVWEFYFSETPGFPSNQSKEIRGYSVQSRAVWSQLIEDTLWWRNMTAKEKSDVRFKLDKIKVQQHATKMGEIPLRNTNFVHCKLNIISYTL